jgi:succinate CoA transferase
MIRENAYPVLTPEEAASFIQHGNTVAFSGFSPAGAAKAVPVALARRAIQEHEKNRPFKLRILTGASSGQSVDDELAKADAVSWRAPYQGETSLRQKINHEEVEYVDIHLSHVPQMLAYGFLGKLDVSVVEATEITRDGRVYLTSSIGASPTCLKYAEKVIIEINQKHSPRLREMADIFVMPRPPHRDPIPIHDPLTRIGWPYASVDPKKVLGIVFNDEPDHVGELPPPDDISHLIAQHVVKFLCDEMAAGRLPKNLLPLQAGVGSVANGVLAALGEHPEIPPFSMYSEVFQDAMVDIMAEGKLISASACSLTVSWNKLQQIIGNMDFFAPRIVLRPQEISNHPGIIRRLGVIAMNTALEADIYGNVNSTHLYGMDVMNGIGGSGEFTRNAYLSMMMTASIARGGKISSIVPMCPHIDHNEHSVQVIVTEQGLADLRGLGPSHRAEAIINNCAHPMYRDYLNRYVRESRPGHIRHDLTRCYELHRNLMEHGSMLP